MIIFEFDLEYIQLYRTIFSLYTTLQDYIRTIYNYIGLYVQLYTTI